MYVSTYHLPIPITAVHSPPSHSTLQCSLFQRAHHAQAFWLLCPPTILLCPSSVPFLDSYLPFFFFLSLPPPPSLSPFASFLLLSVVHTSSHSQTQFALERSNPNPMSAATPSNSISSSSAAAPIVSRRALLASLATAHSSVSGGVATLSQDEVMCFEDKKVLYIYSGASVREHRRTSLLALHLTTPLLFLCSGHPKRPSSNGNQLQSLMKDRMKGSKRRHGTYICI